MGAADQAGERQPTGDGLLSLVWGCVVIALLLYLLFGLVHVPLSLIPGSHENHEGIGLAAVPLAGIAGGVIAGRSAGNALRSAWKPSPPLAAAALAMTVVYLFWALNPDWAPTTGIGVLTRALGALLAAAFAFVGVVYWPRRTAILAGAIGGASLFGLVVLAFPETLFHNIRYDDDAQVDVMAWSILGCAAGMFTLALVGGWLRWWPRVLSYAVCSGAFALLPTMVGYFFILDGGFD